MENKVSFIDAQGQRQQVALSTEHWKAAYAENLSLRQYVNINYPSAHAEHDTFTQMCASAGLNLNPDNKFGLRSTPMKHIFDTPPQLDAAVVDKTHPVQSRVLFPAFMLNYIEDKMTLDRTSAVAAINEMVAITTTVPGYRAEQPVISYDGVGGPESSRARARAQLAKPARMLSITAADRQLVIPEMPIGIEISDEASVGATLDLVTLAFSQQQEVEGYTLAGEQLLGLLQGDADIESMTGALPQVKANTFDSSIAGAGELTDAAYEAWLYSTLATRQITHLVTDRAGARAIRFRTGRLETVNNYEMDPRTVSENIFYPQAIDNIRTYVVDDTVGWPANTIMGLNARAAIHKFSSTAATYSDVERFVLRRGTGFVVSYGEIMTRQFDNAFSVLSLTV